MQDEKKNKIAVILSGGGTKSVYCAGALLELQKRGVVPDILIAGSGSVCIASYFIANQLEHKTMEACLKHISNKKFINIFRLRKVINIDYLIDVLFKKLAPIDIKTFQENNILYLIPTTHKKTGEIKYFSNKVNGFNIYETMRTAMSFPILYHCSIINGFSNYQDGIFSALPYYHIETAKELGAEQIIIIDSGVRISRTLYRFYLYFKSKKFRERQLMYLNSNTETKIKDDKSIIVIKPNKKFKNTLICNKKDFLISVIEKGKELNGFNEIKFH